MHSKLTSIPSEQISVVIQGPLYRNLAPARGIDACIKSVRKHLPKSEIIISTWPGEDLEGVDADILVSPADPGALLDFNGNRHNTNRQVVSTLAGIEASTRAYVLKLRTDHILSGSGIAVIGGYDESVPTPERLLRNPITVSTLFIRNPVKTPFLFHISDLIQFGERVDMLDFWDQKLRLQDEVFNKVPYKNPVGNFVGYSAMRMTPEQCLMLGFMCKKGYNISLKNPGEISPVLVGLSEKLLAENFTVLDWAFCEIDFPERFLKYSLNSIYKASELAQAGSLSPKARRSRYRRVWLNKYFFNCASMAWWIALASILLTTISPRMAKAARSTMRRLRGLKHPNNDRV